MVLIDNIQEREIYNDVQQDHQQVILKVKLMGGILLTDFMSKFYFQKLVIALQYCGCTDDA